MTMIQLIACIGMIAGFFMVLHVSPRELSDSLFSRLTAAPGSIRADGQTSFPWCASHLCSALHWEPASPLPQETLSLCRCWLLV